jgi:hypothetical protein
MPKASRDRSLGTFENNMKPHSIYITTLAILTSVTLATAGTFEIGSAITAADLASQLDVHSASMIYRQDKPFSKITVGLIYKERSDAGKLEEKESLVATTYPLPGSTKEQTIKILFSSDRSTVIVGSATSGGKGLMITAPSATYNPPYRMKDGTLVLASTYSDPKDSSEEGMKSIVQLIVIPSE